MFLAIKTCVQSQDSPRGFHGTNSPSKYFSEEILIFLYLKFPIPFYHDPLTKEVGL
jgi:hypothetical protein